MAIPAALAMLPQLLGIGAQTQASKSARATTEAGARSQAEIEGLQREAAKKEFQRQIAAQKPYLDVGTKALPELITAISNKDVDVSGLPATTIQGDLISEFLGDEAPAFIKDRAMTNLEAVEAEKRKGRLADLVSVGLGGAMSTAGAGVDLGTALSRSTAREGSIMGKSLQDSAIARQNLMGQTVGGLAGLPALYAAYRGPGTQSATGVPGFQTYDDQGVAMGPGGMVAF